jgi:hypothetical protein
VDVRAYSNRNLARSIGVDQCRNVWHESRALVASVCSAKRDDLEELRGLAPQKAFARSIAVAIAPYLHFGFIVGMVWGLPTA